MEEKKVKVTIHCGDYLDDVLRTLDWIIRNRKELIEEKYGYGYGHPIYYAFKILRMLVVDKDGRIRTGCNEAGGYPKGFNKIQIPMSEKMIEKCKKDLHFEIEVEDNDRTNHKEEQNPGTAELWTAPEA